MSAFASMTWLLFSAGCLDGRTKRPEGESEDRSERCCASDRCYVGFERQSIRWRVHLPWGDRPTVRTGKFPGGAPGADRVGKLEGGVPGLQP